MKNLTTKQGLCESQTLKVKENEKKNKNKNQTNKEYSF